MIKNEILCSTFDIEVFQRILLALKLEHFRDQLATSLGCARGVGLSQVTPQLWEENAGYVFQAKAEFRGDGLQPSVCS